MGEHPAGVGRQRIELLCALQYIGQCIKEKLPGKNIPSSVCPLRLYNPLHDIERVRWLKGQQLPAFEPGAELLFYVIQMQCFHHLRAGKRYSSCSKAGDSKKHGHQRAGSH